MKKKHQKIQIVLISIGLLLIFVTYFYHPYTKKVKLEKNQKIQEKLEKTYTEGEETFFENVEYKGFYDLDKPFTIKSKKAHMLDDEPDIVYMNDMHVILYLSDGRIVNIISDKGKYNKFTYDCFFEKNVRATDGEINILAENLDLLAAENSAKVYNKVNLSYPNGSLKADKIDYNFETKYFKVSMFDDESIQMKVIK